MNAEDPVARGRQGPVRSASYVPVGSAYAAELLEDEPALDDFDSEDDEEDDVEEEEEDEAESDEEDVDDFDDDAGELLDELPRLSLR